MITDDYKIFCDRYHKKQHLSDDLIKYIMDINTFEIIKQKDKQKHKELFMNDFIEFNENNYKDIVIVKQCTRWNLFLRQDSYRVENGGDFYVHYKNRKPYLKHKDFNYKK